MINNLYVIIPVHNRIDITKNCLISLKKQSDSNFKIVVIDDGSTDGTSEMIRNFFPDVILLNGDGNLWWSGANNMGIKFALNSNADYILCLNDDLIVKENFIEKIKFWSNKYPESLFGCISINIENDKIIYAGTKFIWKIGKSIDILNDDIKEKIEKKELISLDNYVGRGLLIPARVFKEVGLFDEKGFPQSGADQDLTFKISKKGYNIYVNPDAKIYLKQSDNTNIYLKNFNLKNFFLYLTSRKSSANIYYQVKLGWRHAPMKYKLNYCIFVTFRCIGGYFKRWIKSKKNE